MIPQLIICDKSFTIPGFENAEVYYKNDNMTKLTKEVFVELRKKFRLTEMILENPLEIPIKTLFSDKYYSMMVHNNPRLQPILKNIVPYYTNYYCEIQYYDYLRQLFYNKLDISEKNRYIISRKNNNIQGFRNYSKRHLVNENELLEKLPEFQLIHMENYTFLEQVALFSSAHTIISPHGAALIFSLFSNKNTKIIELSTPEIKNLNHFKDICDHLQLNYIKYDKCINIDENNNMLINVSEFSNFVSTS